jgi:hypothetical protein
MASRPTASFAFGPPRSNRYHHRPGTHEFYRTKTASPMWYLAAMSRGPPACQSWDHLDSRRACRSEVRFAHKVNKFRTAERAKGVFRCNNQIACPANREHATFVRS